MITKKVDNHGHLWYTCAVNIVHVPQYSLKHAAHMIGVSDKTIRRWLKSGKMIGYQVGGRKSWYTDLEEINKMRELYALPKLSVEDSIEIFNNY